MHPIRSRAILLPAMLFSLTACGSTEPSRTITILELTTPASLVVGEHGWARVSTMTNQGCFFETPCYLSASVEVSSSRPDIVRLDASRLHTGEHGPVSFELTAVAPGTATIIADSDQYRRTSQVSVVEATAIR